MKNPRFHNSCTVQLCNIYHESFCTTETTGLGLWQVYMKYHQSSWSKQIKVTVEIQYHSNDSQKYSVCLNSLQAILFQTLAWRKPKLGRSAIYFYRKTHCSLKKQIDFFKEVVLHLCMSKDLIKRLV